MWIWSFYGSLGNFFYFFIFIVFINISIFSFQCLVIFFFALFLPASFNLLLLKSHDFQLVI